MRLVLAGLRRIGRVGQKIDVAGLCGDHQREPGFIYWRRSNGRLRLVRVIQLNGIYSRGIVRTDHLLSAPAALAVPEKKDERPGHHDDGYNNKDNHGYDNANAYRIRSNIENTHDISALEHHSRRALPHGRASDTTRERISGSTLPPERTTPTFRQPLGILR